MRFANLSAATDRLQNCCDVARGQHRIDAGLGTGAMRAAAVTVMSKKEQPADIGAERI